MNAQHLHLPGESTLAAMRRTLEALQRLGTDWHMSDDMRTVRTGNRLTAELKALQAQLEAPAQRAPYIDDTPSRAQRWRRATSRGYRHDHERY